MDPRLVPRVLFLRATLLRRDQWDAERIARHQEVALRRMRRAAYASSDFYRRHHAGLLDAPLNRLPPVTKIDLMEHFDEAVTAPQLRLSDLEDHLRFLTESGGDPGLPWRGRWWAAATAGTTGRSGTFVWNRREWATVLASYARAADWAGTSVGLTRPLKAAIVSSRIPTHQSAVVGASLRSGLIDTLRLDVTAPIEETVVALNRFQPRVLAGYASALKPLASEQLAGHACESSRKLCFPRRKSSALARPRNSERRGEACRSTSTPPPKRQASPPLAGIGIAMSTKTR